MPDPFTLRLLVPSGNPEEMRHVSKGDWIGIGFVVPRSSLKMFTEKEEAQRAGVYVLSGPSLEDDRDRIYIGEADPLGRRLIQHQANKDFWTTAYVFTAQGAYLNKALIQYLEKELLSRAKEAKRCHLDNKETGNNVSLSPMDKADADAFLKNMLLCYPVLGLRAFEKPMGRFISPIGESAEDECTLDEGHHPQDIELYSLSGKEAEGKGYESPNGFTVLQGARGRKECVSSATEKIHRKRDELVEQSILTEEEEALTLTQDYEFRSPSAAAEIFLGRTANGLTEWKHTKTDKTLKKMREEQAQGAIPQEEGSSQNTTHDLNESVSTDGTAELHDQSNHQEE